MTAFCDIHSFTSAYSPGWTFGLPFRGFLITHIQTHGRTPGRVISPSQRPLPTQDNTTYRHNRQTSMPRAGLLGSRWCRSTFQGCVIPPLSPQTSFVCDFSWIKIFSLPCTFLRNQVTMMRFRYIRYCILSEVRTTGAIKKIGAQNVSENGRGAWVALCPHPIHTTN
jgi:hypothetical protein